RPPKLRRKRIGRAVHKSSAEMRDIEVDREPDERYEAQAPPDAPAPKFDPVGFATRTDRVPGGEMIRGAPRRAGERRGCKGVALAQLAQARQRLAPLLLVAFLGGLHHR